MSRQHHRGTGAPSNNASERAGRSLAEGAAGASDEFAPTAPRIAVARPAQVVWSLSALPRVARIATSSA